MAERMPSLEAEPAERDMVDLTQTDDIPEPQTGIADASAEKIMPHLLRRQRETIDLTQDEPMQIEEPTTAPIEEAGIENRIREFKTPKISGFSEKKKDLFKQRRAQSRLSQSEVNDRNRLEFSQEAKAERQRMAEKAIPEQYRDQSQMKPRPGQERITPMDWERVSEKGPQDAREYYRQLDKIAKIPDRELEDKMQIESMTSPPDLEGGIKDKIREFKTPKRSSFDKKKMGEIAKKRRAQARSEGMAATRLQFDKKEHDGPVSELTEGLQKMKLKGPVSEEYTLSKQRGDTDTLNKRLETMGFGHVPVRKFKPNKAKSVVLPGVLTSTIPPTSKTKTSEPQAVAKPPQRRKRRRLTPVVQPPKRRKTVPPLPPVVQPPKPSGPIDIEKPKQPQRRKRRRLSPKRKRQKALPPLPPSPPKPEPKPSKPKPEKPPKSQGKTIIKERIVYRDRVGRGSGSQDMKVAPTQQVSVNPVLGSGGRGGNRELEKKIDELLRSQRDTKRKTQGKKIFTQAKKQYRKYRKDKLSEIKKQNKEIRNVNWQKSEECLLPKELKCEKY